MLQILTVYCFFLLIHIKDTDFHSTFTDTSRLIHSPHAVQTLDRESIISGHLSNIYHTTNLITYIHDLFTLLATILKRKPYVTAWQHEDKWRKHFPRCGWWNVLSVRPGSAARTQEPVFLTTTPGVTTSTLPRHRFHDTTIVWHHDTLSVWHVSCFLTSLHTGAAEDGWTAPCPMSGHSHHLQLSNCLLF